MLTTLLPLGLALGTSSAATQNLSYTRDVRPILAEHCFSCHGPDARAREADLRLDTAGGPQADRGGRSAVVPGRPGESVLLQRVAAPDEDRMPPLEHGPGLKEEEVAILRRWIEQGAPWEPHWAYAPFREVPVPPLAEDWDRAWHSNPIDAFVAANLSRRGLRPSAPADRRTLIRRLTLDLWGMVPTPAEVEAFLADEEDGSYERLVDRLLASVHYAERQTRHWLDLARYADSHGFTIDGGRTLWPWRDWVIDAIDQGMPFDRFTLEQLAGDLLPEPTNAQLVATGFHRNTQINQEGGAKDEENRVAAVIDRVNTTGAVWLGSTLACAQCHDHKYDPVTQVEYFQLFSFFNQSEDGGVSTGPTVSVSDEASAAALEVFEERYEELARERDTRAVEARGSFATWRPERILASNGPELRLESDGALESIGHRPVTSVVTLDGTAPAEGFDALRLEALPGRRLSAGGPGRAGNGNFVLSQLRLLVRPRIEGSDWRELALSEARASYEQDTRDGGGGHYPASGALSDEPGTGWAISPLMGRPHVWLARLGAALPPGEHELRVELHHEHGAHHTLGRFRIAFGAWRDATEELVSPAWIESEAALIEHAKKRPSLPQSLVMRERQEPRPNHVFRRGSFLDPGARVSPGYPAAWSHFSPTAPPRDRLDLARWLMHPANALVHRVTVNRWWQRFFGRGLVETENDFGLRGAQPSHPDLLEWLAQELVRQDFSMRALHRLMVTSQTYRQSSRHREQVPEAARSLAAAPALRIEAEAIRDSALRASGLLSPRVGGPPVQPPQPEGVFAFTQSRKNWKVSEGQDRYRRSLYTRIWRSAVYPFFTTFDAPVPNVSCTRRAASQSPLQALTLANDPMVLELAQGLARRLLEEIPKRGDAQDEPGDQARIARAFALCLSRPPTQAEERVLEGILSSRRNELADLEPSLREERAWTAVTRVLFNLGEFVTRR